MPRIQAIPEELIAAYQVVADETCQTQHRWMALGITIVSDEHANHVRAKFRAWKHLMRLQGEIKWSATDQSNLERYKTLANIYMALIAKSIITFHALLICMDVVDYSALGDDVPELSYNRFFHHLLMTVCRLHGRKRRYYITFDRRTSRVPLEPFRLAACRAAKRDFGMDHWPFRRLVYEDSKDDILLQVNDLILGAIGYRRNAKHKDDKNKSSAKAELALHILRVSPCRSFWQDTAEGKTAFTLRTLKFGGKKGKEALRDRDKFKRRHETGKGRDRKHRGKPTYDRG